MNRIIQDDEIVVDTGRADGGRSFIRVTHTPSGKQRMTVGLAGRSSNQIVMDFIKEIEAELSRETKNK